MRKTLGNINLILSLLILTASVGGSFLLDDEAYEVVTLIQFGFAIYYFSYIFGIKVGSTKE